MTNSIFKKIDQLSQANAEIIANDWHYEGEYSFYDMENDQEDYDEIMSQELRSDHYYQVLDGDNKLVAFFCLEPDDQDSMKAEIGLGLAPSLTGHGLGKEFIKVIEDYVKQNFAFKIYILSVAEFNKRAIKVYQKAGYQETGSENVHTNGGIYKFIIMTKSV